MTCSHVIADPEVPVLPLITAEGSELQLPDLGVRQNHPQDLLKQTAGSHPQCFCAGSSGAGQSIWVSHQFSGSDAACPQATL